MREIKRSLCAILLVVMLVIGLTACAGQQPASSDTPNNTAPATTAPAATEDKASGEKAAIGDWKVDIVGVDGVTEIKSSDIEKLNPVTLEATIKNKKGETKTNKYTGVKLKDILDSIGVKDFKGVTVEAGDGFSAEYDKTLATNDDTILAWAKDGEALDEKSGPVQMTPVQGTGNQFVKNTSKIIINK
jgi:DMSO/TMAO reductase YedYZ molybdopterin-dependent catalytic subunit